MTLNLYEIGRYTDTKLYYISRLESVGVTGSITRVHVLDNIKTKKEARTWLRAYNTQGLRPAKAVTEPKAC